MILIMASLDCSHSPELHYGMKPFKNGISTGASMHNTRTLILNLTRVYVAVGKAQFTCF